MSGARDEMTGAVEERAWPPLPGWVRVLRLEARDYQFGWCQVWDRRPVLAEWIGPGSRGGPVLVITEDEAEMRAALGLPGPAVAGAEG